MAKTSGGDKAAAGLTMALRSTAANTQDTGIFGLGFMAVLGGAGRRAGP